MFLNNLQPNDYPPTTQDKNGVPASHPSVQPVNNSQSDTLNDFNPVEMSNRYRILFIQDNLTYFP